ncbi:MAG TPA: hypothetical protein VHV83_08895 [Armatimonadota bacterium]|nr:hypothetical protein [Armatimonadota bacterium]
MPLKCVWIGMLTVFIMVLMGCGNDNGPSSAAVTGGIVFDSTLNGVQGIYAIDSNGGNLHVIAANGEQPSYEPFGSRIAFVRDGEIYLMHDDGSGQMDISQDGETVKFDENPCISWDGSYVALDSGPVILAVGTVGTDGAGGIEYLFYRAKQPAISPDGKTIAFIRYATSTSYGDIVLGDSGGTYETNLTNNSSYVDYGYPTFSPDGETIAFTSNVITADQQSQIETIRIDGTHHTVLIHNASHPSYAPSGDRIAFVRDKDIYTARSDGSDIRQLTKNGVLGDYSHISWGGVY